MLTNDIVSFEQLGPGVLKGVIIFFQILSITNKLQTLFLGLGNNEVSLIKQTELKALTFKLGSTLANSHELATQMKAQEAYVSYLSKLQR